MPCPEPMPHPELMPRLEPMPCPESCCVFRRFAVILDRKKSLRTTHKVCRPDRLCVILDQKKALRLTDCKWDKKPCFLGIYEIQLLT